MAYLNTKWYYNTIYIVTVSFTLFLEGVSSLSVKNERNGGSVAFGGARQG